MITHVFQLNESQASADSPFAAANICKFYPIIVEWKAQSERE